MEPFSDNFRPRRILLIKPSALGDVVHTLPFLRLLRRRFSSAHIAWLIAPAFAPLIEGHPDLDEVIGFDRRRMGRLSQGVEVFAGALALGRSLADRHFDLVVDLQGLVRSAMLAWSTHSPVRIGFAAAREGAPLAYTHRVPGRGLERHAVERYLDVAEAIGCGRAPVEFDFAIRPRTREEVDVLLADGSPYAVLLPGTNWETKKWPIEHYARLAPMLAAETGLRVVVAGGPDVVDLAAQIPAASNLAARTTLPQLVALLERASLVIANDSGPMHIASALGRPLVTLFGPTSPVRTGPYARPETVTRLDLVCSPCYSRKCVHTSCMHWLTPARVLSQALAAMNAGSEVGR